MVVCLIFLLLFGSFFKVETLFFTLILFNHLLRKTLNFKGKKKHLLNPEECSSLGLSTIPFSFRGLMLLTKNLEIIGTVVHFFGAVN